MTLSPIQLEVLWNRLLSVANEQQTALIRTAFSTIVRESLDLACGIFDTRGHMIAQSLTGTPGHINPMATGVIHFLNEYPPETLEPGDVLITNDPWKTAGQVNDFTVLTPVFRGDQIVAYFANCCHSPDVGARILSAEAREVFEEGLQVPITKLFRRGEPNEELFKIIRANVRTPDETVGDLYAQTSCNAVGARSLLQMMDEFRLDTIDPLADEIISRSEKAMRDAIRALPNGSWTHEIWNDGFEGPLLIKVNVTIKEEDIFIDFDGSSPQSDRGINVVLNYTRGYASFAMKAAISPEVPHNEGSFRPVKVTAQKGRFSTVPARPRSHPAICLAISCRARFSGRSLRRFRIESWPDRPTRPGCRSGEPLGRRRISRRPLRSSNSGGPAHGRPKTGSTRPVSRAGSVGSRPRWSKPKRRSFNTIADFGSTPAGPANSEGVWGRRSTWDTSARERWSLSAMIDRTKFSAHGLLGGGEGEKGRFELNGEPAPPKTVMWFDPDAVISLQPPGGGGYGDPLERDPERVRQDVVLGYVTLGTARDRYGVVVEYTGPAEARVRLPEMYRINEAKPLECAKPWHKTGEPIMKVANTASQVAVGLRDEILQGPS